MGPEVSRLTNGTRARIALVAIPLAMAAACQRPSAPEPAAAPPADLRAHVTSKNELQLSREPPPGQALGYVVCWEKDQESPRTLQACGAVAGRRPAEGAAPRAAR